MRFELTLNRGPGAEDDEDELRGVPWGVGGSAVAVGYGGDIVDKREKGREEKDTKNQGEEKKKRERERERENVG